MDVDAALAHLKERLAGQEGFPHEIGLFLDYPLGDVIGFIENAGHNFKCSGCWKVYCNECEAVKLFARYKKCRDVYLRLWHQGRSVLAAHCSCITSDGGAENLPVYRMPYIVTVL